MSNKCGRVLILGASGMLGNAVMRFFAQSANFEVFGSARSQAIKQYLLPDIAEKLVFGHDLNNSDHLVDLFGRTKPDLVINCVGLVKQLDTANDPLQTIPINSLLPHRLACLCEVAGARLVHISTDCIFSGATGMYKEADASDARDLYGRSKYLGEVDYPNAITLRTSIIGHELDGARSLVGWFLAQKGSVNGFKRAIFSGLPTVEIARVIRDHVIPYPELHGLYHVSAEPINKFDLLTLIAQTYDKTIDIVPHNQIIIDRSLDSTRFREATGFLPKAWPDLIRSMREFG
jgi:dTDP-4-dehydrorhamnose reductase